MAYPILICTVGTSLLKPNLEGLKRQWEEDADSLPEDRRILASAYVEGDWNAVCAQLGTISTDDRVCGAEINSIGSLVDKGYVEPNCGLCFLHSATDDGRQVASVLTSYYKQRGHNPVQAVEVADLQDQDPKRFRTKGLRNLVREIMAVMRRHSPAACAINATGGYKAQIAIAVVLGQAMGATVFYKHERFNEIISFPPLPIALDFEIWMRASGMLYELVGRGRHTPTPADRYAEDWDEKFESLVERTDIDGKQYLDLSPAGQIFHDTFHARFRSARDQMLPPNAIAKKPPRLENAGWPGEHPEVEEFMRRVTDEVPFVVRCSTYYYNPDLPQSPRFTLSSGRVVGVFSDGTYCVKFCVETTAQTEGQRVAAVAALNEWLVNPDVFRSRNQVDASRSEQQAQEWKQQYHEVEAAWDIAEKQVTELRRQNEDLSARCQLDAEEQQRLEDQAARLQTELEAQREAAKQAVQTAENLTEKLRACEQELARSRIPWWRRLIGY